jgi:hypothetical protein
MVIKRAVIKITVTAKALTSYTARATRIFNASSAPNKKAKSIHHQGLSTSIEALLLPERWSPDKPERHFYQANHHSCQFLRMGFTV